MKNLSRWRSSIARAAALSRSQKWLLIRAFFVLAVYKGLLLIFPFNMFLKKNTHQATLPTEPDEQDIDQVVWAIRAVSRRIPLGFTCLVQALGAKWLLKKYPDIRVCIGVHKSTAQGFSAHAWLTYKHKIVLGEQATQVFQPILEWN